MAFSFTNSKERTYFLHERATKNGRTLYFFAKEVKDTFIWKTDKI